MAEGRITRAKATKLCSDLVLDASAPDFGSPSMRRFRAMSPKEQDSYLEQVAERAARDYESATDTTTLLASQFWSRASEAARLARKVLPDP